MARIMAMAWVRGDTYDIVDEIEDNTGTAVDITGYAFDFVVRQSQLGTILLALEIGDGIAITDAEEGELTITVTATQTESLAAGEYFYAVRKTNAGTEKTVTMGKLSVAHSAAVPAP